MLGGAYQIEVDTPFGRKPGLVVIRTDGDVGTVEIDAPLVGKQRLEVRVEGDSFTAEGTFKMKLVGKLSYALAGQVEDDELRVSIASSKGTFELTGKRV
ncbi:MAG: hypothetical protein E7Z99_08255 [Coriobacteriaceae bacterium]|jgi:hypothetical protein|nr:hypothetical protein [Coriobacteriaceae bacterium]